MRHEEETTVLIIVQTGVKMKTKKEHSVSNPQRIKIESRRAEQAKWRSHKKWKKLVEDHAHIPGAICVHCLKHHGELRNNRHPVILTINHISRTSYFSEELYCTWDENDMEICCTVCNWNIEKGLRPCPICHATYIHWRDYTCQACWDKTHPIEAQKRIDDRNRRLAETKVLKDRIKADKKAEKERYKIDHPKVKKVK